MADFCSQCSVELFGDDFRDLAGLCEPEELVVALCEGCGPTRVDHNGHCMTDCMKGHYNNGHGDESGDKGNAVPA